MTTINTIMPIKNDYNVAFVGTASAISAAVIRDDGAQMRVFADFYPIFQNEFMCYPVWRIKSGKKERLFRTIPIGKREVFLIAVIQRLECKNCGAILSYFPQKSQSIECQNCNYEQTIW